MKLHTSKGANVNYLAEIVHVDKFSTHPNTSIEDVVNVDRNLVDLSKIWHDASEMPKDDEWILTQFHDCYDTLVLCDLMTELFYARCKKYGDIRWAYIDDLLPKQFGNSEQLKGGEK